MLRLSREITGLRPLSTMRSRWSVGLLCSVGPLHGARCAGHAATAAGNRSRGYIVPREHLERPTRDWRFRS